MAAVSLATLDARARARADMVNSGFVTDDLNTLWGWIQEGAQKLHDLLVQKFGGDYFSNQFTFFTIANQTNYPLPTDFLKLQAADFFLNNTGYPVDIKKFSLRERNAYRLALNQVYGAALPRYRINGSNFIIFPAPPNAYQVTLWYAPLLQVSVHGGGTIANLFVNADDTVNFPNGWERYIVLYAAIVALKKEESETASLEAELAACTAEIEAASENRDAAAPEQAVDMDRTDIDPRIVLSLY